MAPADFAVLRSSARTHRLGGRLQNTRARRTNRRRSSAGVLAEHPCVDPTQESAKLPRGTLRYQLDPVAVGDDLHLFAGLETDAFADTAWDDDLEFRRHRYDFHRAFTGLSIIVSYYERSIDVRPRDAEEPSVHTRRVRQKLVLVHFSQFRNEPQSSQAQAIQLALSIGQNRRAWTHVARDYRPQLWIVCRQKAGDLSKLRGIAGESENREIRLVERSIEREIRDQRGMTVEEYGETILECDEERGGRAAIRARCKGVVMGAGSDLERNPFQDELIADARAAELLLLESVADEPASQWSGNNDRCTRQRGDFDRIPHVVGVSIGNENEIRSGKIVERNGSIRVRQPGTGNDHHALGGRQAIELVAQPFDLDFSLLGRWRLGEASR